MYALKCLLMVFIIRNLQIIRAGEFSYEDNTYAFGDILILFKTRTVIECAMECQLQVNCSSLNYFHNDTTCELLSNLFHETHILGWVVMSRVSRVPPTTAPPPTSAAISTTSGILTTTTGQTTTQASGDSILSYGLAGTSSLVPNHKITVSGNYSSGYASYKVRICSNAWSPQTQNGNQWVRFDLGMTKWVNGIVTRGMTSGSHFVKSYKIKYHATSASSLQFLQRGGTMVFPGTATDTKKFHVTWFSPGFEARYLELIPVTWNSHICVRVEILGCKTSENCIQDFSPLCSGDTNPVVINSI